MENNIILPNKDFNFDNITILSPSNIQGKTFLSKIQFDNNDLYIQTPKCISKNGFNTTGKRSYVDLLFEKDNDEYIEWFENLENRIQDQIFNKREKWFRGEKIEKSDIEDIFTSSIKTYKSGKYYAIRVYLGSPRVLQHGPLNIFDENENPVSIEDIDQNSKMITILQLHGLKFNANINFQLYIEVKQILIIDEEKYFQKPLFKMNNSTAQNYEKKNKQENIIKDKTIEEKQNDQDVLNNEDKSTENNNNLEILNNLNDENLFDNNTLIQEEPKQNLENTHYLEEKNKIEDNLEKKEEEKEEIKNDDTNKLTDSLEEYNPNLDQLSESFKIKKPDDVYIELYKDAKEKAKNARLDAIKAYMELKHIKQNYNIKDLESDEEFSESEFISSDEEDIKNPKNDNIELDFEELK